MKLWKVALIAFAAMLGEDLFYTVMTVLEAHYNYFASIFDELGWLTATVCATLAVTELGKNGWFTAKAKTLLISLSAGNILGTILGVFVAKQLH